MMSRCGLTPNPDLEKIGSVAPDLTKKGLRHMCSLIIFIFLLCVVQVHGEETRSDVPLVGGACEYRNYKGGARIISITKVGEGGEPSEDRYEVKFFFLAKEKIEKSFARVEGRELILQIGDQSSFGRRFLEKNCIRVGETIDCILKVITRGTCTPVLFEFPSVKTEGE